MSKRPRPAPAGGPPERGAEAPLNRSGRWTALLRQARDGDRAAFDALMEEAEPCIRLHALQVLGDPSLADDVTAETFEKVWVNLSGYNEELSNARTWIYLIAGRIALDYLDRRTRQRRTEVAGFEVLFGVPGEEGDGPGLEPEDPTDIPPPEGADRPLCRALVEEALGRLAARDRTVLQLYHVEGRSYEEIAAFLHCSVKAVGPRLTRARERFRQALHPEARP